MIELLIVVFIFWIIPAFLGLRSIYKRLPTDSTIRDLLEWRYSTGYLCLIPIGGYVIWIDNLEFPKIEMSFNKILNKKIK